MNLHTATRLDYSYVNYVINGILCNIQPCLVLLTPLTYLKNNYHTAGMFGVFGELCETFQLFVITTFYVCVH